MNMNVILGICFLVLILAIGGERGSMAIMTLVGNLLLFAAAIYMICMGINPIIVTGIVSIGINAVSLFYQNGVNEKTKAAFVSVLAVMAVLAAAVYFYGIKTHIAGLDEIDLQGETTMYYSFAIHTKMQLVAVSMVLIGLIGALMDTGIAVSSAVYEVYQNNRHLSRNELFASGIAIGKDILGTTMNTLYFAYIGEALMLLLYLKQYQYSVIRLLNSKVFFQDFLCIIFSAIGCVIMIPVCAWVMAEILGKNSKDENRVEKEL